MTTDKGGLEIAWSGVEPVDLVGRRLIRHERGEWVWQRQSAKDDGWVYADDRPEALAEFATADELMLARMLTAAEAGPKKEAEVVVGNMGEDDLIVLMFRCFDMLRSRHGWRDAMYAPCDGKVFEVVEAGSTGIHKATRDEERRFWVHDEFDSWPSDPILWREVRQ